MRIFCPLLILLSFCVNLYSQTTNTSGYIWATDEPKVTVPISDPKGYTTTAPIIYKTNPNAKITPVGRMKYESLSQKKDKTLFEEITQALECVTGDADSFTFEEREASLLILESSYANGLVTPVLNKAIQSKLFAKINDDDAGTIWSGVAFGIISNYVATEERDKIYQTLKAAVITETLPLSARIGAAEGLGYVIGCSVKDISTLLTTLGTSLDEQYFLQESYNGMLSFYLFRTLGRIYTTTGDYVAKDKILQYANMNVSVYPFTQSVWANVAAGLFGMKEAYSGLETIARWHEVNGISDLGGIQAIPIDMSKIAWMLLPKYIRDVKKIAYPEISGTETAAGWTLWSLNMVSEAFLTVICWEMATASMVSVLYGLEAGAASSYLAADAGSLIASRYGTSLAYELSLNTARTEFANAFASTTTGKIVNRIYNKVNVFNQKFGAQINKLKSIKPKAYIEPQLKTDLKSFVADYKTNPNEPLIIKKDATDDLLIKALDNPESGFNVNINDAFNSSSKTTPGYVPPSSGGFTDVAVTPKIITMPKVVTSPTVIQPKDWTLPKTIVNNTSASSSMISLSKMATDMAIVTMPNKLNYLLAPNEKKITELSATELQEWKHPTKLVEEFKNKELVVIEVTQADGSILTYTVWIDKEEKGQAELAKLIANLKTLGSVKVNSSSYDNEGKLISKQENPYDVKNSVEESPTTSDTETVFSKMTDEELYKELQEYMDRLNDPTTGKGYLPGLTLETNVTDAKELVANMDAILNVLGNTVGAMISYIELEIRYPQNPHKCDTDRLMTSLILSEFVKRKYPKNVWYKTDIVPYVKRAVNTSAYKNFSSSNSKPKSLLDIYANKTDAELYAELQERLDILNRTEYLPGLTDANNITDAKVLIAERKDLIAVLGSLANAASGYFYLRTVMPDEDCPFDNNKFVMSLILSEFYTREYSNTPYYKETVVPYINVVLDTEEYKALSAPKPKGETIAPIVPVIKTVETIYSDKTDEELYSELQMHMDAMNAVGYLPGLNPSLNVTDAKTLVVDRRKMTDVFGNTATVALSSIYINKRFPKKQDRPVLDNDMFVTSLILSEFYKRKYPKDPYYKTSVVPYVEEVVGSSEYKELSAPKKPENTSSGDIYSNKTDAELYAELQKYIDAINSSMGYLPGLTPKTNVTDAKKLVANKLDMSNVFGNAANMVSLYVSLHKDQYKPDHDLFVTALILGEFYKRKYPDESYYSKNVAPFVKDAMNTEEYKKLSEPNTKDVSPKTSTTNLTKKQITELTKIYFESATNEDNPDITQIKLIEKLDTIALDFEVRIRLYYVIMYGKYSLEEPAEGVDMLKRALKDPPTRMTIVKNMSTSKNDVDNSQYAGVLKFYNRIYNQMANNLAGIIRQLENKNTNSQFYDESSLLKYVEFEAAAINAAKKYGLIDPANYEKLELLAKSSAKSDYDKQLLSARLEWLKEIMGSEELITEEYLLKWLTTFKGTKTLNWLAELLREPTVESSSMKSCKWLQLHFESEATVLATWKKAVAKACSFNKKPTTLNGSIILPLIIKTGTTGVFPSDKIKSNNELKADINKRSLSCVFSNETNIGLIKPVVEKLGEGVLISVAGETGIITGAMSPNISYLLLLDSDSEVVLYNRWKLGMIGISQDTKDLLYLLKKATHQEIIDRVNKYAGSLPFGSKDALIDPYYFNLFTIYTRKSGYLGDYMTDLLSSPSPVSPFYKANYHFYEDQYNNIKSLVVNNKVSAHFADITDATTMNSVAALIKQKGMKLSALNLSDAWLYGVLFKDKGTVNNKSTTEYDPTAFETLINSFKEVTNKNSMFIQSKSLPEKDLSYVAFNFDELYGNKNISNIPNLMYLKLDRKYAVGFSKGIVLVNPSLELPELSDVVPIVCSPETSTGVCTYKGKEVNWQKMKGKKVVVSYEKTGKSVVQDIMDKDMLGPELLKMAKRLFSNTHNSLGVFRETMIFMVQVKVEGKEDKFFISEPFYSSTWSKLTSKGDNSWTKKMQRILPADQMKAFNKMMLDNGIDPMKVVNFYAMHTHPDGKNNALPLSAGDVDFEEVPFYLWNVKTYNLYALPVHFNGDVIFHTEIKAKGNGF